MKIGMTLHDRRDNDTVENYSVSLENIEHGMDAKNLLIKYYNLSRTLFDKFEDNDINYLDKILNNQFDVTSFVKELYGEEKILEEEYFEIEEKLNLLKEISNKYSLSFERFEINLPLLY